MKKFLILLIFTVSISYGQGYIHADGKYIVDGDGNEFMLRGIGLGGWLVPEGYMIQTSGSHNSPTEIYNAVIDLVGQTEADNFIKKYRENFVTSEDIKAIAEWGFNSIRLPLHYNLLTPLDQPNVYLEEGFAFIDSTLKWCKENNIYLILDLHCAPGGQNDGNISDYLGYPSLWESTYNQQKTVDLWKEIASRYKDEKYIGGYDLLNETAWELGDNSPLRNLQIDITQAIRTVDTNHIVFVEGNWYATEFSGMTPPWDNNMAYSFHKYWNGVDQGSIQYLLSLREQNNVPLWLGETGENSNAWFTSVVQLCNQYKIGYSWWTHKKIENISGLLSAEYTPGFKQIVNYWNGSGSKPSQTAAAAYLSLQADKLKFSECKINKDVIDALFRQTTDETTLPFAENIIPGKIYAVDYDLGRRGSAYNDSEYQNTNNNTYNNGWTYRNDGVDIEECGDSQSNGYDVGWTATGEWLKYTVNIQQSGTYSVLFRIASAQQGGMINMTMDGSPLIDFFSVPVTGGWQTWNTVVKENIWLPAGQHQITTNFLFGGFNINSITFNLVSTDIEDENEINPEQFKLSQNYPNPYNPSTTINFSIQDNGFTTIDLFDIKGEFIANILANELNAGNHLIQFNASQFGLASGTYIYRLKNNNSVAQRKMILLK